MNDDESVYFFLGLLALGIVAIIMMAIPVKTEHVTIVNKQWQTTTELRERYEVEEYVCHTRTRTNFDGEQETYRDCGYETVTKTRTLESSSLSGGAYDAVVYPPEYATVGRQFNVKSGTFVVSMTLQDGESKTRNVSESEFVSKYIPGLECTAKLNIYGRVIKDDCVAIGR